MSQHTASTPPRSSGPGRKPKSSRGRAASTQVGFVLWRGGLAFCACYIAYRSYEQLIRILLEIGIPAQVVWGVVLFSIGVLLLLASLIVERVIDARSEKGLKDG